MITIEQLEVLSENPDPTKSRLAQECLMLRKEIIGIEEALSNNDGAPIWYANNIEHHIKCHADNFPRVVRLLAKAIRNIQKAGEARHEKEDPG